MALVVVCRVRRGRTCNIWSHTKEDDSYYDQIHFYSEIQKRLSRLMFQHPPLPDTGDHCSHTDIGYQPLDSHTMDGNHQYSPLYLNLMDGSHQYAQVDSNKMDENYQYIPLVVKKRPNIINSRHTDQEEGNDYI